MASKSTNSDFWKDRKVCVTGGDGFLGSYVLEKLAERGATQVFVPKIEEYNIVDPEAVKRLLADASSEDREDLVDQIEAVKDAMNANATDSHCSSSKPTPVPTRRTAARPTDK